MVGQPVTAYHEDERFTLHAGDALAVLQAMPDESVNCCVTSPPYYGLRDYGHEGQYGLEESPAAYVETMRGLFAEVRRVLTVDGTLWLNLGDTYSNNANSAAGVSYRADRADVMPGRVNTASGGVGRKNLLGMPWRVAFALQDDEWILRNSIIWHKTNAMPSSVTDRLSNRYENLFLFSKSTRYHFDLDAIREEKLHPDRTGHTFGGNKQDGHTEHTERSVGAIYEATDKGKNPGDVWSIATQPFRGAHFAVMPQKLAERCIIAGSRTDDVVLDPFSGSSTVGKVALDHGRRYVGIDLSNDYHEIALSTRLAPYVTKPRVDPITAEFPWLADAA